MLTGGWTAQGKVDILRGVHKPEDEYRIALYGPSASLGPLTDTYTTKGEVSGKGYNAGGKPLKGYTCEKSGVSAFLSWNDNPTWPVATIKARGALIYNASKENAALLVLDFGQDYQSTNGPFRVPFPTCDCANGLLRIV